MTQFVNVFDYLFQESNQLEKDFVVGNKETISFEELHRSSLLIASYLSENIGSGEKIILVSENSVFFITVYLAILKSGNVCVPLDANIEQENLNYISKLVQNKIVFAQKKSSGKLSFDSSVEVIDEMVLSELIDEGHVTRFNADFDSQNLAQILFTSGSTGKPKGVMLSHQNIISNTNSILGYLKLNSDDRILTVLPFSYCYGLSLLHTHLKAGGSMVLNNKFLFLGTVINDLKQYKCTGFSGVPSHFQILLKKSKTFTGSNFPDLKYFTQAGGKLHDVFIKEIIEKFPKVKLFVMYGQTEATARLSYLPADRVLDKMGSVGKAIPDVKLKIVNQEDEEVRVGEIGEIIAKGPNIMLGYFKNQPANENIKNGWLYTGDLGKRDNEGFIYITARKKEIIKIGGKRVSPKEVEEVILAVPGVLDCSVQAVHDDLLGEAVKAIVLVGREVNQEKVKKEILVHCSRKLSKHKIPQRIEFNNTMKLKSTGKKINSI